jgi:type I restriction enzyme S subunit
LLISNLFYSCIRNHIDSETAQPNFSANSIGEFILTLPSLDEQWQIAGILEALDEKIELNRRVNANLEAHALFWS